jgi:hypothetical protein
MKSVIFAAIAAMLVFALPAQAADTTTTTTTTTMSQADCDKARDACKGDDACIAKLPAECAAKKSS